jgi:ergothioneine biosynthesis glutamate--cysteine ligase EgtA
MVTFIDTGGLPADGLHEATAAEHIHGICLKTGPPRLVGVELEWLVRDVRDPALPVPAERTAAAVAGFGASRSTGAHGHNGGPEDHPGQHNGNQQNNGDQRIRGEGGHGRPELPTSSCPAFLPSGALLTAEPGGQLELSSQPAASLAALVAVTSADLAALGAALAADGLELAGIGLDPLRPPRRVLGLPRYAAMEAFFDLGGHWGRQMMGGTASVQVCLDAGDDSDGPGGYRWRWRLLHALGPVLVAAFANSPLREGKPTGWVSSRQQIWSRMDPGRTRAPRLDAEPRAAWADYALDAQLMCIRGTDAANWSAPPGLTLRDWIRGPAPGLRRPAVGDIDYHLSTLFPPVRPRGHFELRMIDAQPGDGWIVPLAVCCALLSDARAEEAALAAVAPLWGGRPPGWPPPALTGIARPDTGAQARNTDAPGTEDDGPWLRAARLGPADPAVSQAGRACFAAAREALARMAVPAAIAAAVDAFTEDYVSRDRCPADDLLEVAK